jgi:hypothetical protein
VNLAYQIGHRVQAELARYLRSNREIDSKNKKMAFVID